MNKNYSLLQDLQQRRQNGEDVAWESRQSTVSQCHTGGSRRGSRNEIGGKILLRQCLGENNDAVSIERSPHDSREGLSSLLLNHCSFVLQIQRSRAVQLSHIYSAQIHNAEKEVPKRKETINSEANIPRQSTFSYTSQQIWG